MNIKIRKKVGFEFIYSSGLIDGEGNSLIITFIYPQLFIKLPNLLKHKRVKKTYFKQGSVKNYYNEIIRTYGIRICDTHAFIYYGDQPGVWISNDKKNSDKIYAIEYPWTYGSCVRHTFLDIYGNRIFNSENYETNQELKRKYKYAYFKKFDTEKIYIDKFDGERVVTILSIEEREWQRGRGIGRKLLNLFFKPLIIRTMEINFLATNGVGKHKNTWKGGTIATNIIMKTNETIDECWDRFLRTGDI